MTNAMGNDNANGTDAFTNEEAEQIHHTFDSAIGHFLKQFAQKEPTSNSANANANANGHLLNLSFTTAANILRKIEEKVVNLYRYDWKIEIVYKNYIFYF
jgi:hypothetical protein